MNTERLTLTKEQALKMLPDKESIHTFRSGGAMIIGCDCSRESIVKAIESHVVELSGEAASGMGHGMCLNDGQGWLFIETVAAANESSSATRRERRDSCKTQTKGKL